MQQPQPGTGTGARLGAELCWELGSLPHPGARCPEAQDGQGQRHHQEPTVLAWPCPFPAALPPRGVKAGDHPGRLPPKHPKKYKEEEIPLCNGNLRTNTVPERRGSEPADEVPCCTAPGNMAGDEITWRWWWGSGGVWSQGQDLARCWKHYLCSQPERAASPHHLHISVCCSLHMPSQGPEMGSAPEPCFPAQPGCAEMKEPCTQGLLPGRNPGRNRAGLGPPGWLSLPRGSSTFMRGVWELPKPDSPSLSLPLRIR